MSGPYHPTGHARVSMRRPAAQAVCDRCYRNFNLQDLKFQFQWAGTQLVNVRLLVCDSCRDIPQQQLRSIIIPADPLPVLNPRPEAYSLTVPSDIATEPPLFDGADDITTEGGDNLIWEIEDTPSPDPLHPAIYPGFGPVSQGALLFNNPAQSGLVVLMDDI